MKRLIGLTLIAMLSAAAPAMARASSDPSIDQRQERLAYTIERGWRAGDLSAPEYRRLRQELRDIDREEHYLAADGWLSPRDRDRLHASARCTTPTCRRQSCRRRRQGYRIRRRARALRPGGGV